MFEQVFEVGRGKQCVANNNRKPHGNSSLVETSVFRYKWNFPEHMTHQSAKQSHMYYTLLPVC